MTDDHPNDILESGKSSALSANNGASDAPVVDPNRFKRAGTPDDPDASQFLAYARQLLIPIIVTKSFIMYFGLNYSMYPGEGYGWGLAAAIIGGVCSFSYFIWSQYQK